ncbi:MAG: sugar ABC transporter substrate-binding protein [Dysgonamonadaceae bacterium]|jgi:ABC-type sugar transport system substrate-binding protein|nr:sugar ABC transporter substrate-binding protein [Dysgonamonadaceae bacterium]
MKKVFMFLLVAGLVLGITARNAFAKGQNATQGSEGKIRIAYVVKAMSDQFWIDMRNGAEVAAKEFNVELSFQAPDRETDVERQIQMVENAIISKVDAIILSAASSTALNPVIVKVNKANIPVILVNDTIDENALAAEGGFVETYVGIDQYAAAALAGDYCAQNIAGGKVLLLEGPSGVDALAQRLAGFRDKVMGKPGFEIAASQTANCDRNEGFNVTQNVLTARPDINIIWSVNAEMGQGAIQAIEQAGRTGTVSVFDFDASNDDIQAVKAGTLVGSVAQYPEIQARAAIQACIDVLGGKKLSPHTVTKAELITRANVVN